MGIALSLLQNIRSATSDASGSRAIFKAKMATFASSVQQDQFIFSYGSLRRLRLIPSFVTNQNMVAWNPSEHMWCHNSSMPLV